ncbi:MAG TPA: helix-turn-helix domain-containing protein [Marmoricola sp.]|nr:helix-turn-helix domain-containing protein [Marmoricola sp.]
MPPRGPGSEPGSEPASEPERRRDAVLAALKAAAEPMSVAEVAELVGLRPNTVRFHLDALERQDRIERAHPAGGARPGRPGRPALHYRVRPGMDPSGPRSYQLLAEVLVDSLANGARTSTRALAAGEAFGRRLARETGRRPRSRRAVIDTLVDVLAVVGFAPERRTTRGETRIGLRHCPFLELTGDRRDVICPVHLGLMRGIVSELAGTEVAVDTIGPVSVESLEPFVEPDLCLARLGSSAG